MTHFSTSNMSQKDAKTLIKSLSAHYFFSTTVPQKTQCKNEGARNFEKISMFCNVHLSLGEKQILETRCVKQHAFWSIHWMFHLIFAHSIFDVFRPPKKEGLNQEKGSKSGSRVEISTSRTSQRSPFRPNREPTREAIPSLERRKGPRASRSPRRAPLTRFRALLIYFFDNPTRSIGTCDF